MSAWLAVLLTAAPPLASVQLDGFPFVQQKPDFCGGVTPARVRDWLPEPCREPQTGRRARSPDQQFNPRPGAFAGAVGFPPPEEFQGNHAGWGSSRRRQRAA